LVLEKNNEPGGYCTSFRRRGFVIDTTIHAIQNCEKGNILHKIFFETDIIDKIKLKRGNPTDTILMDDFKIDIMNNIHETLEQFVRIFPRERASLKSFFDLFIDRNLIYIFSKYKYATLQSVLDEYFNDERLKRVWGIFLSNIGSLPENTSMLTGYALLKQFIISGGYYPSGGMQTIPNALVSSLENHNGEILYKRHVEEILISKKGVQGVLLKNGEIYYSLNVVSNSDLTNTLENMLHLKGDKYIKNIKKFRPSLSIYIVYILLKKVFKNEIVSGAGIWYVPNDKVLAEEINNNDHIMANKTIFCSMASKLDESLLPPGHDYLRIMINTHHKSQHFWASKSKELNDKLINQVMVFLPNLKQEIVCIGRATSGTMNNYTLNLAGAMCGWWNSPEQVNNPVGNYLPKVRGLYFCGHWITQRYGNGGVAMAAESGRKAAWNILKVK